MLEDGINGKFDLILTKSVSRFARNTADTLKWVNILKENNVGIYFQEENIYTLGVMGEFLLTIIAGVAQQESENTSEHINMTMKNKMLHGKLVGLHTSLGYKYSKKTKQITTDRKESLIVKEIFDLFLNDYNYNQIQKIIESKYGKSY